jgi:hypothetical protein
LIGRAVLIIYLFASSILAGTLVADFLVGFETPKISRLVAEVIPDKKGEVIASLQDRRPG